MADEEQLRILREGVDTWNKWRAEHPDVHVNLFKAYLRDADLRGANFRWANFRWADLSWAHLNEADISEASIDHADLMGADLGGANLSDTHMGEAYLVQAQLIRANLSRTHLWGTNFMYADLRGADLRGADMLWANLAKAKLGAADLRGANLGWANLSEADLCEANLSEASLSGSLLLNTLLNGADLTACRVFGVSAWGLHLEGAKQTNLVITPAGEPAITVDNLEVAQFIYLLLNNEKIRDVIDTITTKVVLILGRFTPERKTILDALRDTLREHNYLPVVFDFDKPASRDLTETVSTLAHLARFIIADITDPKSIPQELQAIVPDLAVPVQPIIARPQQPWGMFVDFPKKYHWVLEAHEYADLGDLLDDLQTSVIAPAEAKAKQLAAR